MKTLTRTELTWVVKELKERAAVNRNAISLYPDISGTEKSLLRLRADQLSDIADKLQHAIDKGDKRIAID